MKEYGFAGITVLIILSIVLAAGGIGGYFLIREPSEQAVENAPQNGSTAQPEEATNTQSLFDKLNPFSQTSAIASFSSDKTSINSGETITINWEVSADTTSILLSLSCDTGVTWNHLSGTAVKCGTVLSQSKPTVNTLYHYYQVKLFNSSSADKSVTATLKAGTESKDIKITVKATAPVVTTQPTATTTTTTTSTTPTPAPVSQQPIPPQQVKPAITILSPKGHSGYLMWHVDKTHNITWESSGVDYVNISLETESDAGPVKTIIAENVPAQYGNYTYKAPMSYDGAAGTLVIRSASDPNNIYSYGGAVLIEVDYWDKSRLAIENSLCRVYYNENPELENTAKRLAEKCKNSYHDIESSLGTTYPRRPQLIVIRERNIGSVCAFGGHGGELLNGMIVLKASCVKDSPDWMEKYVVIHEMVHVAQFYEFIPFGASWIPEGIADYVTYQLNGEQVTCNNNKYTDGYICGATLLKYIQKTYAPNFIINLDMFMKNTTSNTAYTDIENFFISKIGKGLSQLWSECLQSDCEGGKQ